METKELKIRIPAGYEFDPENSTSEQIVFKKIEKPDPKTYEEVAELSIRGKDGFYIDRSGTIVNLNNIGFSTYFSNTALTREQLEWVLALNKLQNVANYINDGWKPDWEDDEEHKYYIDYSFDSNMLHITFTCRINKGSVYFKSPELAEKAIKILGEEVKKALGVYKGC